MTAARNVWSPVLSDRSAAASGRKNAINATCKLLKNFGLALRSVQV